MRLAAVCPCALTAHLATDYVAAMDENRDTLTRLMERLGDLRRQQRNAVRDLQPSTVIADLDRQIAAVRAEVERLLV